MSRLPLLMTGLLLALPLAAQELAQPIQIQPTALHWQAGPPSLPAGTQSAVLEGDPKKSGLFTLRLKVPAGAQLPPHWHPREERVTVLEGSVSVGFGEVFDAKQMTRFDAGAYYVNPPQRPHFVMFPEASVIQITGFGPWELHLLKKP